MEFRLLGPLEVRDGDRRLALGAPKQRAVLARLLLDRGRTVAAERLVDDLWGAAPPPTAPKMVQIYVSQLRKILPPDTLATRPPGYAAEVGADDVDVERFRRLHEEGRALLATGDPGAAAERLTDALGLWRGTALADFDEPFAETERRHLEELRLACLEDRVEADLACGRHGKLVAELQLLTSRHPLRERLRGQVMMALYRAGRQADALEHYQGFHRTLRDELGIAPSEDLAELERRILRHDPALRAPSRARAGDHGGAGMPAPASGGTDVRYVRSGDVSIAYQVVGAGPPDLVLVHGWVCSFHPGWEHPPLARFYRRLAAMGRLILFDKRGTGLSDRVHGIASLEERMDDVRAVMDAVGSRRAIVLGISEGGPMAAMFAAAHPERAAALVAMGTFARRTPAPDYPIDIPRLQIDPARWGVPIATEFVRERAPSAADDEAVIRWYASYLVRGASPGAAIALRKMNDQIDVRHVLPAIHVPTLVLYREREYLARATRDMGERIRGAQVVELPGADHIPWEGDQDAVLDRIERFVAGLGEAPEPDHVLATVLHAEWRDGEAPVAGELEQPLARFGGRPLEGGGANVVRASFDGPARAIRCATVLRAGGSGSQPAVGVHTGECEVVRGALRGVAVDLAGRIAAHARPGEVLASATVRDLVAGTGLTFGAPTTAPLEVLDERREWALFPC